MTKKTKFWLVGTAITMIVLVFSLQIDIDGVTAAPTKVGKSTGVIDKLIFFFSGGNKKDRSPTNADGKRRSRIAGSRGCGTDIIALIPRSNLGVTISNQPNIWIYLGKSDRAVKLLQLSLFKSDNLPGTEIWTTQLSTNSQKLESGLLKIPYQGQLLTDGTYQWKFSYQQVDCKEVQTLAGYLQKETHPDLAVVKKQRERLQSYAKQGIWHDLLTELITLRQQQPHNNQFANDFRSLIFESEDIKYTLSTDQTKSDRDLMEDIVNARTIDCCQFVTIK
jgi:Domain of Unknown Function (DUF928)